MKAFGRNSHFFRKKYRLSGTLTPNKYMQTTESLKRIYSFKESEAEFEVKGATEEETTEEEAMKKAHSFEKFEVQKVMEKR
jgi:hypothetical protein